MGENNLIYLYQQGRLVNIGDIGTCLERHLVEAAKNDGEKKKWENVSANQVQARRACYLLICRLYVDTLDPSQPEKWSKIGPQKGLITINNRKNCTR